MAAIGDPAHDRVRVSRENAEGVHCVRGNDSRTRCHRQCEAALGTLDTTGPRRAAGALWQRRHQRPVAQGQVLHAAGHGQESKVIWGHLAFREVRDDPVFGANRQ